MNAEHMSFPQQEEYTASEIALAVKKWKNRQVNVKRTNGEIESDWFVKGILDNGRVIVEKQVPGEDAIAKRIPLSEIEQLNPDLNV
jgi:hypothetical protein